MLDSGNGANAEACLVDPVVEPSVKCYLNLHTTVIELYKRLTVHHDLTQDDKIYIIFSLIQRVIHRAQELKTEGDLLLAGGEIKDAVQQYANAIEMICQLHSKSEPPEWKEGKIELAGLHLSSAICCNKLQLHKDALQHAKECLELDSSRKEAYLESARALRGMSQKSKTNRELKSAVSHYIEYFNGVRTTDIKSATESLNEAILLGANVPGCTEILQKVLVRPEFSTRLLQNLVTKKESKTTHILFLLEQMPRSITTRFVPIQHLFDASQVNVLNVINKEDIDKNLLQKLTECGMVIECVHLEKAIEVLPDRENTLPVLDFLIDHTHAQSDQLTPVCHKSIQSQKTLISSHLIKHGARPLPSEVMSLVESSAKFYPVFIVYIAQSDICEKAYRTKLFKISCEQMKNSPDYSDTALKVLKSGPIDTTDIDLGTLFKSSAELLHSPLLIKQLLEAGVSAESSLAVHPLTLVMRYKEIDCETRNAIVCMLLEKGASCEHLKVSSPGTTSLHVATKLALETSDARVVELVAKTFPFPDNGKVVDSRGDTPLHLAAKHTKNKHAALKVSAALCQYPLDPTVKDKSKRKQAIDYILPSDPRYAVIRDAVIKFQSSTQQRTKKRRHKKHSKVAEVQEASANIPVTPAKSFPVLQEDSVLTSPSVLVQDCIPSTPAPQPLAEGESSPICDSQNASSTIQTVHDYDSQDGSKYSKQLRLNHEDYSAISRSAEVPFMKKKRKPTISSCASNSGLTETETLGRYIDALKEKEQSYFVTRNKTENSDSESDSNSDDDILPDNLYEYEIEAVADDEEKPKPKPKQIHSSTSKARLSSVDPNVEAKSDDLESLLCYRGFDDLEWDVECTAKVLKFLKHKKMPKVLRKKIVESVYMLVSEMAERKSYHLEHRNPDVYATVVKQQNMVLLWEKAVQFSAKFTNDPKQPIYVEVIRIWDIVEKASVSQCVKNIVRSHQQGSESTTAICCKLDELPHSGQGPRMFKTSADKYSLQFVPPASPAANEYNVVVFHDFSSTLVKKLLTATTSDYDAPMKTWPEEHSIITLTDNKSILLLGRSGTGKTTCCLYRMWNQFKSYWSKEPTEAMIPREKPRVAFSSSVDESSSGSMAAEYPTDVSFNCSQDQMKLQSNTAADAGLSPTSSILVFEHLHQVFITKNSHLCNQIRKHFYKMAATCDFANSHIAYRKKKSSKNLAEIPDFAYPLFLTSQQFWIMLDGSLEGEPFFPRTEYGTLSVKILSSEYDPVGIEEDNEVKTYIEVDSIYFEDKIWKSIPGRTHAQGIDPLLVWMEIKSFIKGSARALQSESGELSEEEYLSLGESMASNFPGIRPVVYELYKAYKFYRQFHRYEKQVLFDECDLIHHLYKRLLQTRDPKWSIHNFYVDEVQDFTQGELLTLLCCCNDQNGLFFTGDTAQSIMRDVAFRFEDLRSQFHEFQKLLKQVTIPDIHILSINYRSHSGILEMAGSVLTLLKEYFPKSLDILPVDRGMFEGPSPVLVECCDEEDLKLLLASNKTVPSEIEFGHHQAIIVRTKESIEKLPSFLKQSIVLTVFEAKGLEFDDVLLYNFFTDSRVDDAWRVASQYLQDNQRCIKNVSHRFEISRPRRLNEMRDKSLNAELKHLYTAITRAKRKLWIFDSNKCKRLPMFDFWCKQCLVEVIGTQDEHSISFSAVSSQGEWKIQGDYFKRRKYWEQARLCYQKAGRQDLETAAQAFLISDQLLSKTAQKNVTHITAALAFLESDELNHDVEFLTIAAHHLIYAERYSEAALVYEKLGKVEKAVSAYSKIRDFDNASRVLEEAGNYSSAVKIFCDAGMSVKALESSRRYEKKALPLDPEFKTIPLAQCFAKLYSDQKHVKKLTEVLQFLPIVSQKIVFLKHAEAFEAAFELHIQQPEYNENEALHLILARGCGWYDKAKQLPLDKTELVIQKARSCIDSHPSEMLPMLEGLLQHSDSKVRVNACVLLARSTMKIQNCEAAVDMTRQYNNVVAEVEALQLLDECLCREMLQKVAEKPITQLHPDIFQDLDIIFHGTTPSAHEFLLRKSSKSKTDCSVVAMSAYRKLQDSKFTPELSSGCLRTLRRLLDFASKAREIVDMFTFEGDSKKVEHYCADFFGITAVEKDAIYKKALKECDELKIVNRKDKGLYLLPNEQQDIWVCKLIPKRYVENRRKHSDLDGMYLLDKGEVHKMVAAHYTKYLKSVLKRLHFWVKGTVFYRIFQNSFHAQWSLSGTGLQEYLECLCTIVRSCKVAEVAKHYSERKMQDALLSVYSLKSAMYIPFASRDLDTIRKSLKRLNPKIHMDKESEYLYTNTTRATDLLLQLWQFFSVLGHDVEELKRRLEQNLEKELDNPFKKELIVAKLHQLQWLSFCQMIKQSECLGYQQVLDACEVIFCKFLPGAVEKQTISPRNTSDIICICTTALLHIATNAECLLKPPQSTSMYIIPEVYHQIVQVFDNLVNHRPLLQQCTHGLESSSSEVLLSIKSHSFKLLSSALDLLVMCQSNGSPSMLNQVLANIHTLKDDSSRVCVILAFTLFTNLVIASSDESLLNVNKYHAAICTACNIPWSEYTEDPDSVQIHPLAIALQAAFSTFSSASDVSLVCKTICSLLSITTKSGIQQIQYLFQDHKMLLCYVPLSCDEFPQNRIPKEICAAPSDSSEQHDLHLDHATPLPTPSYSSMLQRMQQGMLEHQPQQQQLSRSYKKQ